MYDQIQTALTIAIEVIALIGFIGLPIHAIVTHHINTVRSWGTLQGATSAPKARYQESLTCLAPAPNTKLLDNETGRGSKRGEQAYPMYGKKERSY